MNIKPIPLVLKDTDRCLIIAPHPDDESIGCGGIMARYPKNFNVICLTHGDDERKIEFENAMNYLNVEHEILNLKDKHISDGYEKFSKIDFSGFNYVFVPYIFDQHSDHKAVSVLLNKYLQKNKISDGLNIVFYEVWSAMNMPNYFVDITYVVEKKRDAINFHKSQVDEKDYASKILGLNMYRGMLTNSKAVECFTVLSVKEFKKVIKGF
ncbi:PIG-L family deacetylase [bacterium]|nr:PIG-L family deacetylase [bacterium]